MKLLTNFFKKCYLWISESEKYHSSKTRGGGSCRIIIIISNQFLHYNIFLSVTSSPSSCSPSTPTPPALALLHLFEPDTLTVSSSFYPCSPSSCSPPPPSASLVPRLFKPTTRFGPDDSSSSSSPHSSLPSSSPLFPPSPNNSVRELKSHSPQVNWLKLTDRASVLIWWLATVRSMSYQTLELPWPSGEGASPISSIRVNLHCSECNLDSIILSTHDSK